MRQSQILKSEGDKQSQILRAEGAAQAAVTKARGESEAIQTVFNAIHAGKPTPDLLSYQYLQMLPRIAEGEASKVWVVPTELTAALDAVAKGFSGGGTDGESGPAKPTMPPNPVRHSSQAPIVDTRPKGPSVLDEPTQAHPSEKLKDLIEPIEDVELPPEENEK